MQHQLSIFSTNLTTEGLVATSVTLSAGQTWVTLTTGAVHAGAPRVWVLLLHVSLQGLLVLVMPVALRTLECLAGVAGVHHGHVTAQGTRGA